MRGIVIITSILVMFLGGSSGCYEHDPGGDYPVPELVNVTPAELRVRETLVVDLIVVRTLESPVWSVESVTIPDIRSYSRFLVDRDPVQFYFTPTASHIGHHQFTFTVSAHEMSDSMTMEVEVLPEP